jgi:uncharacterized C2H2 Zn-finger protein
MCEQVLRQFKDYAKLVNLNHVNDPHVPRPHTHAVPLSFKYDPGISILQ